MDYELTSRRQVLSAVGTGTTVVLAGCSGSGDSGNGGEGTTETSTGTPEDTSTGTPEDTSTDTSGDSNEGSENNNSNEPGDYPTQETTGLMAEADQLAKETNGVYAFRIKDYDFLDVEEFPNLLDNYDEYTNSQETEIDSLQEYAVNGPSLPYAQALYLAVNFETPNNMPSDDLYFLVPDHKNESADTSIYVNLEEQPTQSDISNSDIFVQAGPDEIAGESAEVKREYQADFFRNHIDPDGIVHAVDLAEHDYAVEALHSGFGSE